MAAVTKNRKLDGLEQCKFITSQFWRLEVQKQDVGWAVLPLKPLGKDIPLPLPADAKAEAPILWPPDVKSWLIGKDPDAGKDWGQEEKGATEDDMVGWHHQLDGHAFEQTPWDSEGQGSLACCSPWGGKELDTT